MRQDTALLILLIHAPDVSPKIDRENLPIASALSRPRRDPELFAGGFSKR